MQSKTIHVLKNSRVAGLPLAVYLIKLVLDFGQDLPDRSLHVVLGHQAGAQLLGNQ